MSCSNIYILPSGHKICEAQAEFISYAMWSQDKSVFFIFGKRAGRVIPISSVRQESKEKIKQSDKQFIIPRVGPNTRRCWVVGFAEVCVPMWNPELAEKLLDMAEDQEDPEKMIAAIADCPEGSIHGWDQHRADRLAEYREAWFEGLPFRIRDDYSYMYPGDDPLSRELRGMARDQDDRQHFASQIEVKDPEDNDQE